MITKLISRILDLPTSIRFCTYHFNGLLLLSQNSIEFRLFDFVSIFIGVSSYQFSQFSLSVNLLISHVYFENFHIACIIFKLHFELEKLMFIYLIFCFVFEMNYKKLTEKINPTWYIGYLAFYSHEQ